MDIQTGRRYGQALFGAAVLSFVAIQPVNATIIFSTGNQQYTNVNIAADTDALSCLGDIGNTGQTMVFENMIGPDGSTQVTMHCQHGLAFIESYYDSQNSPHTGFSSLTLTPELDWGWTAGDFAIDELNTGVDPGSVTFYGKDQFGNITPSTFSLDLKGQNQFNFTTAGGELVTRMTITVPLNSLLADFKQLSLGTARLSIPEPGSLALLGIGLIGLGVAGRRQPM